MRFFLSILGVVVFIVVVIVLISTRSTPKSNLKNINLDSYNTPHSTLIQTSTGRLTGDGQRVAIQIKVSQSQRVISLLIGYNNTVTNPQTFPNNPAAYQAFLGAMENAGFANARRTIQTNIYGVCPLGDTYQYQLNNSNETINNTWSTSCSYSDGTFAGNGPLIRQLFSLQIPNYTNYVFPYNYITGF